MLFTFVSTYFSISTGSIDEKYLFKSMTRSCLEGNLLVVICIYLFTEFDKRKHKEITEYTVYFFNFILTRCFEFQAQLVRQNL